MELFWIYLSFNTVKHNMQKNEGSHFIHNVIQEPLISERSMGMHDKHITQEWMWEAGYDILREKKWKP